MSNPFRSSRDRDSSRYWAATTSSVTWMRRSPSRARSARSPRHSVRLTYESVPTRRVALAVAWLLAALLLAWHACTVRDYVNLAGGLGLRGAAEASTPLKQIFPASVADAHTWVRHALSLLEGDAIRLRHTDIDNAL